VPSAAPYTPAVVTLNVPLTPLNVTIGLGFGSAMLTPENVNWMSGPFLMNVKSPDTLSTVPRLSWMPLPISATYGVRVWPTTVAAGRKTSSAVVLLSPGIVSPFTSIVTGAVSVLKPILNVPVNVKPSPGASATVPATSPNAPFAVTVNAPLIAVKLTSGFGEGNSMLT